MLLVVAVILMAVPAMATVSITVDPCGTTLFAGIDYSGSTTPRVRAFALDVTVDSDATIVAVTAYKTGESTAASRGYGIFPANIDINSTTFVVDSYGTPVAPVTDPGALGGIGTAGVTLEFGSLYKSDSNKPATAGMLCVIEVSKCCKMTISANATRGNIVMEDVSSTTANLPTDAVQVGPEECGGCGTCPYDATADGWLTIDDVIYTLSLLNGCDGGECEITPEWPPTDVCLDATADGWLTIDDVIYMPSLLNGCDGGECECPIQ